ncbi:MAG: T9SS type A sorting domain-containing protein [Lewinellaceae bacterium]|nr:T9SS type A sorting domain-containing protein [Lewinellaceae bacterium]
MYKNLLLCLLSGLFLSAASTLSAQQSVARRWNEVLLQAIREDFARPPVHARNLFHCSVAMYDAWAAYDTVAETYLLGKTVGTYTCAFSGIAAPPPGSLKAAREAAMSYAVYRVLYARFSNSPNAFITLTRFNNLMLELGYDYNYTSTNYISGAPAALGNYIGLCVLQMGSQDGSNEQFNYTSQYYAPVNPPLVMANPGAPTLLDPNRWQPLSLTIAIDQNGNPIPSVQVFQSPEWGNVRPFALKQEDLSVYERDGYQYKVYHDPGPIPFLDTANGGGSSAEYKWNFELVTAWQAHHDPNDGVMWDISPRSIGNNPSYPQTWAEYHDFYDFVNGGDTGLGRDTNPHTGLLYEPQVVPRGDYTRVLAQYWADGPTSETPPGHWFAILNYVSDNPVFVKKYNGKGPVLDNLEWDVKAYFTLGGAVHDAAVTAWGIKGWYDGVRPVSALRYMADLGQSTDPGLPSYDPAGLDLIPGLIELVEPGDPLAGANNEHVGKIKLYTWKGPDYVTNAATQIAGVGWILAEEWWPYQRKTFVTPPFAGYISGHSTYSRSAAEALTNLTGDEYFPGGLGEFHIAANSGFLGLEKGPSVDITLQWATYRDASDQTSLSRIWGGIHPPFDDIPGRLLGMQIGTEAFELARTYFYKDTDNDGHYSYEDCNDNNADIYPGAAELCDNLDNDCNGLVDDIPVYSYFADTDGDGYGDGDTQLDTCLAAAPAGFVANNLDCNDADMNFNPAIAELCDGLDNNCNGLIDDIPVYTYFADIDGDGYGDGGAQLDTCLQDAPAGFVTNNLDCNDADMNFNPATAELCDGLDNNCNGLIDDIPVYTYFADTDGDGYGDGGAQLDTCLQDAPAGFVTNNLDCDDADLNLSPEAVEICDGIDNNCNGTSDEGLNIFTFYADGDEDGYGDGDASLDTCLNQLPAGFVTNELDCDDTNELINPNAWEIPDGIDNNCNGMVDEISGTQQLSLQTRVYPNPVSGILTIYQEAGETLLAQVTDISGQIIATETVRFAGKTAQLDFSTYVPGLYILKLHEQGSGKEASVKVVKINW